MSDAPQGDRPEKRNGRPPYEPTDAVREQVKTMSGFGVLDYQIAMVIGISQPTLKKYFSTELAVGEVIANNNVARSLYRKATGDGNGSVIAAMFWLKCRAGWQEKRDPAVAPEPKPEPLGKKAQREADALTAQQGTSWEQLLN